MPVFSAPPAAKDWGLILRAGDQPLTWGNAGYLNSNAGEGAVRAVFQTPNGGALFMQGGIHWQYWRLELDGTLRRFIRQVSGDLLEWRREFRDGTVQYVRADPFGGGTAGDQQLRALRTKAPFHVTDAASGTTWFRDDTGGVSFGVARDGSVLVYDLNLTPDGLVPADGTAVQQANTTGRGGGNILPAYLGAIYGGQMLPWNPVQDSGYGNTVAGDGTERALPYAVLTSYFSNLSLPDDKIRSMSAAALASIYYGVLVPEMRGNCPHYNPVPEFSSGMSEAQAYCNEMDIRMRIYSLRPDMHYVLDPQGQKVVGLIDPLKIPIYNGMQCKESIIASIGLSVAIGLVTAGAGAIMPILGTFANFAKFGAQVSDLFAQKASVQEMLQFRAQLQQGFAGLLQETTAPAPPPAPIRSTTPSVGTVQHAQTQADFPLALLFIPVLLLL